MDSFMLEYQQGPLRAGNGSGLRKSRKNCRLTQTVLICQGFCGVEITRRITFCHFNTVISRAKLICLMFLYFSCPTSVFSTPPLLPPREEQATNYGACRVIFFSLVLFHCVLSECSHGHQVSQHSQLKAFEFFQMWIRKVSQWVAGTWLIFQPSQCEVTSFISHLCSSRQSSSHKFL